MGKTYIGGTPLSTPFSMKNPNPAMDYEIVDTAADLDSLPYKFKWMRSTANDTGIEWQYNGTEWNIKTNTENDFTTALKDAYDGAVSWISTNGANLIAHLTNKANPHAVTKAQVGLGNADNTSDANKPLSTAATNALGLKANITATGNRLSADNATSKIFLLDVNGNTLDTLDVGFLNNEGTVLEFNPVTENIDMKNDQGETLSSIPVSAFMTNIGSNLNLSGFKLHLRDSANNVLSTVTLTTENISGLSDALLGKVDKASGKGLSDENYTLTEKNKLASITAIFTTELKNSYDGAVTWISTNGANLIAHLTNKSNPHAVTKAQVGLGNVPNTDFTEAVALNTAKKSISSVDASMYLDLITSELRGNVGQVMQMFTYDGYVNRFTLTHAASKIVYVSLNGILINDELSDWNFVAGELNKIDILSPMQYEDKISIQYQFIITS